MQAGKYNTRVTLQEKVIEPDGGGGSAVTWPELGGVGSGSRWAALWAVKPSKFDEHQEGGRTAHTPDYRLILRTDAVTRQITVDCRVLIDGVVHNIRSVGKPDRQHGNITLIVQDGVAT